MGLTNTNSQTIASNPLVVKDAESFEVLQGLRKTPKTLQPKFFYDQHGSQLFDQICQLEEYYLSRTETAIMQQHIQEIAGVVGSNCLLIEYGSGSSLKTRLLLDHLPQLSAYMPVDISRDHLFTTAEKLNHLYPKLTISPIWADFTKPFSLPWVGDGFSQRLAYFPGSTIGNFYPQQAIAFLQEVATMVGPGGGFLIGFDLQKDPAILNLAYNDPQGITAAFNRNMLTHINKRFHANFNENQFEHLAFYNQQANRIEMHLVSKGNQLVTINGSKIHFSPGERVLTEVSYKYTLKDFAEMAEQSGFNVRKVWVDSKKYFSVHYLVAK